MPKPPPYRPQNQMNADLAKGIILRPEEFEEKRRNEEIARAQATLDCLNVIQNDEANLFGLLLQAAIQHDGMLNGSQISDLETIAKEVNARRQKQKWEEVAAALADIGITQTGKAQRHMVWAAKKFGVDLVPITEVDELPPLPLVSVNE